MFRARFYRWFLIVLLAATGWFVYLLYPIHLGLSGDSMPQYIDFTPSQSQNLRIDKPFSIQPHYILDMQQIDEPIIEDPSFDKLIMLNPEQLNALMNAQKEIFSSEPYKIGSAEFNISYGQNVNQIQAMPWSARNHSYEFQIGQAITGYLIRGSRNGDNSKITLASLIRCQNTVCDRLLPDFPGELLIRHYIGPESAPVCPAEPGIHAWRVKSAKPGNYVSWFILEVKSTEP
jgi:hypothetical protein